VYVLRLRARLRTLRPDIVHTVSLKAALYGGLAARLAGVDVVWSIRDRIAEDYMSPPAVRLVRGAARLLPKVIVANSSTTAQTLAGCGRQVRVISPVSYDALPAAAKEDARRPLRVAAIGRLAPWKGQDVFLRAFASAFPDGGETAVIAGDALFGEVVYADSLRALSSRLDLAARVEFVGFRDDVFDVLRDVDVLVHSSIVAEPFGQVIVQGMAAGVAVVATSAGGPAEIACDGVDALLVPPGDAEALSEALRSLRDDPGLRRRIAAAGLKRAADFAPERIAADTAAIYDDLVHRRVT
jgi:glycosyltransferase involved in cell wall biosynthesis